MIVEPVDIKENIENLERRFDGIISKLSDVLSTTGNSGNQSHITINAGGVAIWMATTACLVMLAVNIMLAAIIVIHDRKIDDLNHYLNAVYMMAPQLKPEEK